MDFTQHALERLAEREIPQSDAEYVVANPSKTAAANDSCTNFWGYGPQCGYRIRVTVLANGRVKTVAWADSRK